MYSKFNTFCFAVSDIVVIEPEWLPIYAVKLCNLSKPLEEPAPFYDEVDDCVKCYRTATFGPYQWPVPQTEHVYPDGIDKFRWFARFLLEGKIDPYFQLYSKTLLSPPTILNKSWSKLQPRTTSMIDALSSEDVDSLKKLSAKWIENPTCKRVILPDLVSYTFLCRSTERIQAMDT